MTVTGETQDAGKPTVEEEPDRDLAADVAREAHADRFGPVLREAREKAGLSAADIANALKVTERTVNALEAERYEDLPPRPYIRGYVRRYARLVGLDAGAVTVGSDTVEAEPVSPAVVPRSPWALFNDLARESWGLVYGSIVVVFVILIGAALWWAWPGGGIEQAVREAEPNTAGTDPVPAPAVALPTPDVATEAVSTAQAEPDPALESATVLPEPSEPVAIEPALQADATVEPIVVDADTDDVAAAGDGLAEPDLTTLVVGVDTDEAAPAGDGLAEPALITFAFEGDCWVEVRNPGGDLLHGDLGRDGETVTLRGRAPFSVLLGNPAVVDVTFNGEQVSVDPVRPGQVARFVVGADDG